MFGVVHCSVTFTGLNLHVCMTGHANSRGSAKRKQEHVWSSRCLGYVVLDLSGGGGAGH